MVERLLRSFDSDSLMEQISEKMRTLRLSRTSLYMFSARGMMWRSSGAIYPYGDAD